MDAAPAPAAYRLDDQIGHLLRRVYQRAAANLAARLEPHGLTPVQYAVLARLAETGPVSQNRLGRLVEMEQSNIHGVALRLARRGLIRRSRDPLDRRLTLLALTAEGRRLFDALVPISTASSAATLAVLAPDERAALIGLLRRLV